MFPWVLDSTFGISTEMPLRVVLPMIIHHTRETPPLCSRYRCVQSSLRGHPVVTSPCPMHKERGFPTLVRKSKPTYVLGKVALFPPFLPIQCSSLNLSPLGPPRGTNLLKRNNYPHKLLIIPWEGA